MEASIRCLQRFSCVLCSETHESCQLQNILNFYYPCKFYPKSRSLDSTSSSFRSSNRNCVCLSTALCLHFRCFNREFIFQPIFLVPSGAPIETLRLSTQLSPPFKCSKLHVSQLISRLRSSAPNFTSLNSSLASVQVLQTSRLSTHLSPSFRCFN